MKRATQCSLIICISSVMLAFRLKKQKYTPYSTLACCHLNFVLCRIEIRKEKNRLHWMIFTKMPQCKLPMQNMLKKYLKTCFFYILNILIFFSIITCLHNFFSYFSLLSILSTEEIRCINIQVVNSN